jgi:hypothetical protein
MAENSWETFRQTDADVITAFTAISREGKWEQTQFRLAISIAHGHGPDINVPLEEVPQQHQILALLAVGGSVAHRITLGCGRSTLYVHRPPNATTDKVGINFPDNLDPAQLISILAAVHSHFPTYARVQSIDRLLGDELAAFYRARESGLLRLETLNQKLTEDTDQYRQKLDERFDARVAKADETFAARSADLESATRVQREAIETRATALDAREKSLDDRASRHARRALRGELQHALSERGKEFRLTRGTGEKRIAVHVLYSSLLVLLVALAVYEVMRSGGATDVAVLTRLALTVATIIAVSILYIRWADQWFRQHADEEFRLKRMSLDIDRASWVVETAMEWEQQNRAPIPAQLLEQLSRDLFVAGPRSGPVRHPVEDLAAAVLSASSSLKVNLPGVGEATLNRRGVHQLQGAMGESQGSPG